MEAIVAHKSLTWYILESASQKYSWWEFPCGTVGYGSGVVTVKAEVGLLAPELAYAVEVATTTTTTTKKQKKGKKKKKSTNGKKTEYCT